MTTKTQTPQLDTTTDEFAQCDLNMIGEIVGQIRRMDLLATTGGRVRCRPTGITLPCGYGYTVTVDLAGNDTYTVRRVYTRAGRSFLHGEREGIYCEQLSETVYRAGCFRDEWN